MFKTTEQSAIFAQPMGADGIQFWSLVEHEVCWPWFYLQIVQEDGDKAFRSMLMLASTTELAAIASARTESAWLEKVYIATPGDVNGTKDWKLEPLQNVEVVRDQSDTIVSARFGIQGGKVHSIGDNNPLPGWSRQLCFCADSHLGPVDVNR
ncbi:hypothetical protein [Pseudomonas taetrolens]|uniref:hypothetical protein n=1 Tax=Pseudomonas taetrolens TaxID=47884 RepID=UPI003F99ECB7